jgi:demethylmenaquinone methyltransferase / 2-methoxy-6-polyprenyl-1,4-benzoquinol methylase
MTEPKTTHFGYQTVPEEEKARRVADVFHSVAGRYDLMNDVMSLGLHRIWKRFLATQTGLRPGGRALDLAGGTGDISRLLAGQTGQTGEVWLTDINGSMLAEGRDRLLDAGFVLPTAQCDAEWLPFPSDHFDCVTVAFGLRNMTHKDLALAEMRRVLRPGGRLLVLEFSQVWKPLKPIYDTYSFQILPRLGQWIANDADSYRYLAESIRVHPDQETLKRMMEEAGYARVDYFNLSGGVVALHKGYKL